MGCQSSWPPSPLLTLFLSFVRLPHKAVSPAPSRCPSIVHLLFPPSSTSPHPIFPPIPFQSSASFCISPLSLSSPLLLLPSFDRKWSLPTGKHDKQAPFLRDTWSHVSISVGAAWERCLLTPFQLGQLEETLPGIYTGTSYREQRHERLISTLPPVNRRQLWI